MIWFRVNQVGRFTIVEKMAGDRPFEPRFLRVRGNAPAGWVEQMKREAA